MIDGIRALLGNLAPSVEEALLPGASAEQIGELEAAVGRPLPDDLVRLYQATAGIAPGSTATSLSDLSSRISERFWRDSPACPKRVTVIH